MKWDELQRAILEFQRRGPVTDDDIANLTTAQRRQNISGNPIQVAHHFHKRVQAIFSYLKTNQSLGQFHVRDFFYRVEFQLRGMYYYLSRIECSMPTLPLKKIAQN